MLKSRKYAEGGGGGGGRGVGAPINSLKQEIHVARRHWSRGPLLTSGKNTCTYDNKPPDPLQGSTSGTCLYI